MSAQFEMIQPDDWHAHARQGEMMQQVIPFTARYFGRATIMPNTVPPILSSLDAEWYRAQILNETHERFPDFLPVMTIKLTMNTTTKMIIDAADAGVKAVKLYPTGATTNSQDGVDLAKIRDLDAVLWTMASRKMLLLIHAEEPTQPVLSREPYTITLIDSLRLNNPHLKIVIEHVSTKEMARYIVGNCGDKNLAATVTLHHLYLTLDDLLGDALRPDYFCKPVVKRQEDIEYLWYALLNCDSFFFGSDSAPHEEQSKLSHTCAAGVFSGPICLPLLAQLFATSTHLQNKTLGERIGLMEQFTSIRGAKFYALPTNTKTITLEQCDEPQVLPHKLVFGSDNGDVVLPMPLRKGEELFWRVV